MGNFLYIRPDENVVLFASSSNSTLAAASSTAVDSDYLVSWLTDGRSGRPVRSATVNFGATATFSAGYIDTVVLANTNLTVSAAISGSVTATVPAPTLPANGIPLNTFVQMTASSSATTLTLTVAANAAAVVIGELIAGRARTLFPGPALKDQQRADDDYAMQDSGEFSSLPRYDRGVERRAFSFTQYYSTSQFDLLQEWQRAQRAASRPSVIIPNSSLNDAWVVELKPLKYKKQAKETYAVTMEFLEYPRSRW